MPNKLDYLAKQYGSSTSKKKSKKYSVHDKDNKFKNGEFVSIQENRPISKTKTWVLVSDDISQTVENK